ncbi:hypothetical protein ACIGBL_22605 [Streptomyces sp. NPDC085614]|uniref:hypothetical protein n=1 Tax=Streptomyces sp. NPDC085614 TaxID=3365733 RepID=UPI0037D976D8
MADRYLHLTATTGRPMNAPSQGGLPVDVAGTTAHPGAVDGQGVRVCGQSLPGA